MCGICGIVNKKKDAEPPRKELLLEMMARLRHRGPDSSGYFRCGNAALGHTRLAIVDIQSGQQPITNEDESWWITFNGEIFNYIELKIELEGKGHKFRTASDTEVIIHAWEEWGFDCAKRFNGQWAFALYNKHTHECVLSRDRHGIRPLYIASTSGYMLFASEIKALFADHAVTRAFDLKGVSQIFTFWSPVSPRTAYKDVYEVPAGHIGIIKDGRMESSPYWSIAFNKTNTQHRLNESECVEAFRENLVSSAKLRFTRSDVPVGAYLSGGIDSSVIASIINTYTSAPLHTFSLRFKDAEFDEGMYQREMVERLGAKHMDLAVSVSDIGSVFPEVITHTERPMLRTAPAPLFLLSKLVQDSGYKVVVTGEGADEVLAGYDIFREALARAFVARNPESEKRSDIILQLYPWMERNPSQTPSFAKAFFSRSLDSDDFAFSHRPRWDSTSALKNILSPELKEYMLSNSVIDNYKESLPSGFSSWDTIERAQYIEMTTLLSGYILSAQGDRMLMGHSVEGRFPFLDCNLVDFANKIPSRYKLMGLAEKHILKEAFGDHVTHSILHRPKQPYRAPDAASFFFGSKLDWLEELTSPQAITQANVFNPLAVKQVKEKCSKRGGRHMSNTDNMRIVAILSTMLCHHTFIKNGGSFRSRREMPDPATVIDLV